MFPENFPLTLNNHLDPVKVDSLLERLKTQETSRTDMKMSKKATTEGSEYQNSDLLDDTSADEPKSSITKNWNEMEESKQQIDMDFTTGELLH